MLVWGLTNPPHGIISYPYNYRAIAKSPSSNAIDQAIKDQTLFTQSLTSVSLTGCHEIDIYTAITNNKMGITPSTIVQQILNDSYTTPDGSQEPSPVLKISMSESRGRYKLFTNKNNAQPLLDYTAQLLEMIPRWLQGPERY
jgi:hypothetical protein